MTNIFDFPVSSNNQIKTNDSSSLLQHYRKQVSRIIVATKIMGSLKSLVYNLTMQQILCEKSGEGREERRLKAKCNNNFNVNFNYQLLTSLSIVSFC